MVMNSVRNVYLYLHTLVTFISLLFQLEFDKTRANKVRSSDKMDVDT